MLFGAENGGDFENTFKNANHHLLVELRALGEEGFAAEIVEPENVRAAFGTGGDDFRRADFGETLALEEIAEAAAEAFLEAEDGALALVAQGDRADRQVGFERHMGNFLAEVDWTRAMRFCEDLDRLQAQFEAAGGTRFSIEQAFATDGVFVAQVFSARQSGVLVLDTLQEAVAQAEDDEGEIAHVAMDVDHAVDRDSLAGCCSLFEVFQDQVLGWLDAGDHFHVFSSLNAKSPGMNHSGTSRLSVCSRYHPG